jgi:hypothetical protein
VVLYAFDFVVIVGVGFLVVVLRHFVQEATPRHSRLPQKSQDHSPALGSAEILGPIDRTL